MEKLAEQYKNQPDVQFLSLDIDDDPGLVEPFLKQHKLTIPVLPAYAYAIDTLKIESIPQIWIIGPDEVVHLKAVGYDATGKWVQGMKDAIERFKSQVVGSAAPVSTDKKRPWS